MKKLVKALGLACLVGISGGAFAETPPGPPPGLMPINFERVLNVTSIDAPARTIYLDGVRFRVARDVVIHSMSGENGGLDRLSSVRVGNKVSPMAIVHDANIPMIKEMWVHE